MDSDEHSPITIKKINKKTNTMTVEKGRCLLLDLPAELRNKVYEYALTHGDGLLYKNANESLGHPYLYIPGEAFEFNLLKMVNRQLNSETCGLELKFNTIHFIGVCPRRITLSAVLPPLPINTADYLSDFTLTRMGPLKRSWLHSIFLHTEKSFSTRTALLDLEDTMRKISNIIHYIPHVQIRYSFTHFDPQDSHNSYISGQKEVPPLNFMIVGQLLSMMLRGSDPLGWLQGKNLGNLARLTLMQDVAAWRAARSMQALEQRVPNFRVWSLDTEIPEKFVNLVKSYVSVNGGTDEIATYWIQVAKDWIENGI